MPTKNIRKIIRVGDTSLAIILPIDWLRFYDLKYGDSVEVVCKDAVEIRPIKQGES
jgi:antitoxin component of MazEF toxin-antitoxin module